MKIPSQFNEDSLYGRHRRRGATVQNYRRLIRLGLGLALVLVVMRQSAKPRVYEPFFGGAVGQQARVSEATRQIYAAAQPAKLLAGGDAAADTLLHGRSVDPNPNPKIVSDARAIVSLVPPEDQQLWLATLLRIRRHQEIPQFTVLDTGWTVKLSQLELQADPSSQTDNDESEADPSRQGWSELIEQVASDPSRLSAEYADPSGADPGGDTRVKIQALIRALDAAAASRVAPSGVWQSRDRDALYRYLDEARFGFERDLAGLGAVDLTGNEASETQKTGNVQTAAAPAVPQVGVLPLMQQPDVYLNHVVAFAGRPARVERHTATSNEYQIAHYWHLWLRPVDGADRPLLAVVDEVPESIANWASENAGTEKTDTEEAPVLWITGRFLKRLAYRSSVGADSTPVIVGRILTLPPGAETESASQSSSLVSDDGGSRSLWGMIVFAVLLGVGLAAFAMWRTAVSARQSRELRHAKERQPASFLEQLTPRHGDPSQPAADADVESSPPENHNDTAH